jgi:glycerophosphoryl diester phosphodiesterase
VRRAIALAFNFVAYVSIRGSAHWIRWRAGSRRRAGAVRVIAHRGASAYAPENTLPAFRRAIEQGAREVELDVQLSRDDGLIVYHDADLAPKTDGTGCVRDRDLADLKGLDIGSWFDAAHPNRTEDFVGTRLATLDEVFEAFADGLHYHVEMKSPDASLPERLLAAVERHGLLAHVTVTSFHTDVLVHLRDLDPRIPICQLVRSSKHLRERAMDRSLLRDLRAGTLARREIERAAENTFEQVALPTKCLDRRIVAFARGRGIGVRAWQVRSEGDLDRVLAAGADGATVDWPDRAIAHFAARARRF